MVQRKLVLQLAIRAVNFHTKVLFSAIIMSLRAHTTHDNKPSNLMAAQWNRARVMNARGNSTDRIIGRKTDQRKICIIYKYLVISPFRVLNTPHLYCCCKHIISYDTNVLKQMLRTLLFCHVNIFNFLVYISIVAIFYVMYDWITTMGQ